MKKDWFSSLVTAGLLVATAGCASAPDEGSTRATTPAPRASQRRAAVTVDTETALGFYAAAPARPAPAQQTVAFDPAVVTLPDEAGRVWDPQRRHFAELKGKVGRQALFVDGRRAWPRAGESRLVGHPVWSPDGHGLAIVEELQRVPRLVVMVEYRDPSGDLTWPIPKDAVAPGLKVFWANDNKVVIGETMMRPRFAANWERLN